MFASPGRLDRPVSRRDAALAMRRRVLSRLEALLRRAVRDTPLGEALVVQQQVHRALRAMAQPPLAVWYHEAYRIPLPGFEASRGAQLRRSDYVAWYLTDARILRPEELRTPERIGYRDLARVHTGAWLEAIHAPETLARVFAMTPHEAAASTALNSARLACGGTLAAARLALRERRAALNLGGGFHHAEPDRGGGYCLVNDVAVAIAVLRAEGFAGRVCVLDLDAHPPDGTAACLRDDPNAWIGSISGTHWGDLPGVDETMIAGADDATYLRALGALLGRMPRPDLAFVLSGGDVLAGDAHGGLRLTVEGARTRDERVAQALCDVGSVWIPAGGYHPDSWRVCANAALVLAHSPAPGVPASYDPMRRRFSAIAGALRREDLTDDASELAELAAELRLPFGKPRLLDFYTAEGVEHAFERYGILEQLRRLGYEALRVELGGPSVGDRVRVRGRSRGEDHLLIEVVVERRVVDGERVLYVHWLTLRNPLAALDDGLPALPGQEVRGLGLAREFGMLFARIAERLDLAGVAFTPIWYHMAWGVRETARFVSPERQGRFEAMMRDLADLPVGEVTRAVAEGRILFNGEPYAWEADVMVSWLRTRPFDEEAVRRAVEGARFEVRP
jgi:acetoin utilization deacetylase AcuC-like enzyme